MKEDAMLDTYSSPSNATKMEYVPCYRHSKRQTKTRKFYTPGDGPDGHWVDESRKASLVTPPTYDEKVLDCMKVSDLEDKSKKAIAERVGSLNWNIDLGGKNY